MDSSIRIRRVALASPSERAKVEELLAATGLSTEKLPREYFGAYTADGQLLGGAGLDGNIIKCIAVRQGFRDKGITNGLVKHVLAAAHAEGISNIMIYTKPEYKNLFRFLSFSPIGQSDRAVLLESNRSGIATYCEYLMRQRRGGRTAVAVMNCNPMTLGHRYLIETAAKRFDFLYIIPVKEDKSEYTYQERRQILEEGVKDLNNVAVLEGSDYVISQATFPTYFIKEASEVARAHIQLDCDIFAHHIIPALGVSARVVGTEPTDPLTCAYNEEMKRSLPIEVMEIPRLEINGQPVSASRVRKYVKEGRIDLALQLAYKASHPFVLAHAADYELNRELEESTPAEADSHSWAAWWGGIAPSGWHLGLDALRPYLAKMAKARLTRADWQKLTDEAEKKMQLAVGALQPLRDALVAFAVEMRLAASNPGESRSKLREGIRTLARRILPIQPA